MSECVKTPGEMVSQRGSGQRLTRNTLVPENFYLCFRGIALTDQSFPGNFEWICWPEQAHLSADRAVLYLHETA